jgi:hypothetical protein
VRATSLFRVENLRGPHWKQSCSSWNVVMWPIWTSCANWFPCVGATSSTYMRLGISLTTLTCSFI